jgi:hypothetical protein
LTAAAKPVFDVVAGAGAFVVVVVEVAGGAVTGDCGSFCAICSGVGDEEAVGVAVVCAVPSPVAGLAYGVAEVMGEGVAAG